MIGIEGGWAGWGVVRLGNRPLSCERQHWAVLDVDLRRGHEVSEAERRATTVFDRMRCQGLSYEVLKMTATHCHFVGFVGFVGEWSHGLRLSLADNREVEPAEVWTRPDSQQES
jgi:hypothetical protein